MYKNLFFIFILAISINLKANYIKGCYRFEDRSTVKGKVFYFSLCFCTGNKYYFTMETIMTSDIIPSYFISSGDYSAKKDTLILNDRYHHLKMSLKILKNNTLEVIKLICLAKGVIFRPHYNCEEDYLERQEKYFIDAHKINYKTVYRPSDLRVNNLIKTGKYRGGMDISLDLKVNGDYSVRIDSIYLSRGKWGIKDNKVILYDTYFKSNFFLTIKNQYTLVSALVPGDFAGEEFMLDSEIRRLHPIPIY